MLPPRVSLRRFIYRGQSPLEFGAPRQGQWPPWAVRRFLLYDVLLHEVGHLQEINPNVKDYEKRFAGETKAEEFADDWRRQLQTDDEFDSSNIFQEKDLIHYAPSTAELDFIKVWECLDKEQRYQLAVSATTTAKKQIEDFDFLEGLPVTHLDFLMNMINRGR